MKKERKYERKDWESDEEKKKNRKSTGKRKINNEKELKKTQGFVVLEDGNPD